MKKMNFMLAALIISIPPAFAGEIADAYRATEKKRDWVAEHHLELTEKCLASIRQTSKQNISAYETEYDASNNLRFKVFARTSEGLICSCNPAGLTGPFCHKEKN